MTTAFYVPKHVTQRTGSTCQFSNCWAAVGAWLHGAATAGLAAITPEAFRIQAGGGSGRPNPTTGCHSGFETDMVEGLAHLGVHARILKVGFEQAKAILSQERRAIFGIAVDYDAWPKGADCMNGVAGPDVNHMVGIIGGRPITVMNPLCLDYQAVGLLAVLRAAQKYSTQSGRDGIWLTRVLRPVPVTAPPDEARIAELEAQVADRDDAIAEASDLLARARQGLEPFTRKP
jgi:hypothetical protein